MPRAQLPLAIAFPRARDFSSFRVGDNAAAVAAVAAFAQRPEGVVLLLGASGTGKTHLLVASCQAHAAAGGASRYVAPASWAEDRTEALLSFADASLLALDGLEDLAGRRALEEAVFALFNAVRDRGGGVLVASREHPEALSDLLPDLRSRLLAGLRFRLQPLPEEERRALFRARTAEVGLRIEDAALEYLFRRYPRDLKRLMAFLERLEQESLARQRPATIALIRELLGSES
ncbi:MAG: DnaA regulatory inactivator Hda [Lysobacterales bacterium]|nr:MAG: DnaA regulatory inactivator Hda [Xanthomonadales bacterium]